jgi:hypothetical protein
VMSKYIILQAQSVIIPQCSTKYDKIFQLV